jgi:uncharacterized protein YjiS (DUF1127 family)
MTTQTYAQPALPGALGRMLDRLVVKPFARWQARQQALDELLALDDHMLADIGITRGEIPGIATGKVRPIRAINENKPTVAA